MDRTCQLLEQSPMGQIIQYGDLMPCPDSSGDSPNMVFQFGNITQWLLYDELLCLEWNVRQIDPVAFFRLHPHEKRIHLCTPSPNLCFSFLPDELVDLKQLLAGAVAKLHWLELLNRAVN